MIAKIVAGKFELLNKKKIMKSILLFVLISFISFLAKAQGRKKYTLIEIISQAQTKSSKSKLAETKKEIGYYQFISYRSDLKPKIYLNGNLPTYNKEYFGVRQPDGTVIFQSIIQNNAILGIALIQQLPFSGGELSFNSNLTRFDDFKFKTNQYSGTPFYLKLSQPLFTLNELKWRKKIEPLKYEETKRDYLQEMEKIAQETVKYYFDLIDAQINIDMFSTNLNNANINYQIEEKRINLGTTTEDKLLQLELQKLTSLQNLENAKYSYQMAQLNLKIFIGLRDSLDFDVLVPYNIVNFKINIDRAIEFAKQNRAEFISFHRKLKEAEKELLIAKSAKQQINLITSFGVNNIGNNISDIYKNPNDQQHFNIGFNIPILDWGRSKARLNVAKALKKLIEFNNDFDENVIILEIVNLVKNFEMLKQNIFLCKKTDSIAERRFILSNTLYRTGKLSVTDLNLSQIEKDNSRINYVNALRQYWDSYFLLRRLTLFDFENEIPIKW